MSAPDPTPSSNQPSSHVVTYGSTSRVTARPNITTKRKQGAKITAVHRATMQAAAKAKRTDIQTELAQWHQDSVDLANRLAEKYGEKPQHYLQIMFSGGHNAPKERKPTAYNAWSHFMAKTINKDASPGDAERLTDIQRDNIEEYYELSQERKAELIKELEDEREAREFGTRLSQRSRANDLRHSVKEITKIIYGLKHRVGVEGFFCIVTSTPEFSTKPVWYFSDAGIEEYLKTAVRRGWDTETVGTMVEAFAISGCNFDMMQTTSKEKADYLKNCIRDRISAMLITITGNEKIVMNYVNQERDIVLKYGVELVGWPADLDMKNPSNLTTSLPTLRGLLKEIEEGRCHFHRLPATEVKQRQEAYDAKLQAGEVAPRKRRADAGKQRGSKKGGKAAAAAERPEEPEDNGSGSGSDSDGNGAVSKRPRRNV